MKVEARKPAETGPGNSFLSESLGSKTVATSRKKRTQRNLCNNHQEVMGVKVLKMLTRIILATFALGK